MRLSEKVNLVGWAIEHAIQHGRPVIFVTWEEPLEFEFDMTTLLMEIPTELKYLESMNGLTVVEGVLILPRHARVTDLNRYSFNPGDGNGYRIFEAVEEKLLRKWPKINGEYSHAQYRVKGVQIYP
jgi:hypothetical protein